MRILSIIIILLISLKTFSQTPQIPSEQPKLVIGITVSEMRYDYLTRYWDMFDEGGFKRLIKKGTNCKNVHHDYLITEGASGISSIYTGAYPDVHGIVSNYWYDRLRKKVVSCIEDDNIDAVGGKFGDGRYSPSKMLVTSLSDQLKMATSFHSKVVSISLDPRTSILAGGHASDGSYWYNSENGGWMSNSYYMDSIPQWLKDFNAKTIADLYLEKTWETLYAPEKYSASIKDDNGHEKGFKGKKTFPYELSELSKIRRNKIDYDILKYTPYGNTYTKDMAISAILGENLGKDEYTDWLSVNFASTSYLGELFSSLSMEMEDMYLQLDRNLEHFLDFIDQEIGLKNVLIFLTADNAAANTPSYMIENRMPSGYFNYNAALSLLSTYLNVIYGSGDWVNFYYAKQIFLNRELIEDSDLSISEFQERVARFMVQFDGVANTLTADNLLRNNYTHGTFEKMQKSYNQKRSGDVLLHLNPGWVEQGADREHASSFRFDSHVPLIWYGWKINREDINSKLSVTDIVPTISLFLNISRPPAVQGKVIHELLD